MAKVIIKVRVAYPKNLMETFDSQSPDRRGAGEQASIFCYLPEDPNVTYFILDWESIEGAQKFWASAIAKKHIAAWNAVGSPEILTLNESKINSPNNQN